MDIEIFIEEKSQIEKQINSMLEYSSVSSFLRRVEREELIVTDIPFYNVTFKHFKPKIVFAAIEKNKVIGLFSIQLLEKSTKINTPKWQVMNIGVDENFKRQGIAKKLISAMFKTFSELGIAGVVQSTYSDEGWNYVKPFFRKMAKKFPDVNFIDPLKRF